MKSLFCFLSLIVIFEPCAIRASSICATVVDPTQQPLPRAILKVVNLIDVENRYSAVSDSK